MTISLAIHMDVNKRRETSYVQWIQIPANS